MRIQTIPQIRRLVAMPIFGRHAYHKRDLKTGNPTKKYDNLPEKVDIDWGKTNVRSRAERACKKLEAKYSGEIANGSMWIRRCWKNKRILHHE